jgi:phosphatidylinositol 4-kinase
MMKDGKMSCFYGGPSVLDGLRQRFCLDITEEKECIQHALALVDDSINNWRTIQYDNYQRITNGIL